MIITELSLRDNQIEDAGAKCISEAIRENKVITQLNISQNRIGDVGAKYISKAIKQNHIIKRLIFAFNPIYHELQILIPIQLKRK